MGRESRKHEEARLTRSQGGGQAPASGTQQFFQVTKHSGPIPAPEQFEGYKRVDPRFPDLLIAEWQEESKHRRTLELAAQADSIEGARTLRGYVGRGQVCGFILGMFTIGAAVAIVYWVRTSVGALSGGAAILAGLASLVWGPKKSAISDAVKTSDPRTPGPKSSS